MQFLPVIKQSTDAVLNITTGGGLTMTLEERTAAAMHAKPEMCSLNMGSFNFNISNAGSRVKEWKHDWEKPYLDRTDDFIFRNTFKDVEGIVGRMGREHGARFEYECYDVGHLYNLAYLLERKVVEPPLFVQTILGILGGIAPEPRNLMFMKETADRLFGDQYVWSVLAAGRHQMPFVTMAAIMGGNVRVGLEDSLYLGKGKLATSNAEQVGEDPADPGGAEPGDREPDGGEGDAAPQGWRSGRVLGRCSTRWQSTTRSSRSTRISTFPGRPGRMLGRTGRGGRARGGWICRRCGAAGSAPGASRRTCRRASAMRPGSRRRGSGRSGCSTRSTRWGGRIGSRRRAWRTRRTRSRRRGAMACWR